MKLYATSEVRDGEKISKLKKRSRRRRGKKANRKRERKTQRGCSETLVAHILLACELITLAKMGRDESRRGIGRGGEREGERERERERMMRVSEQFGMC